MATNKSNKANGSTNQTSGSVTIGTLAADDAAKVWSALDAAAADLTVVAGVEREDAARREGKRDSYIVATARDLHAIAMKSNAIASYLATEEGANATATALVARAYTGGDVSAVIGKIGKGGTLRNRWNDINRTVRFCIHWPAAEAAIKRLQEDRAEISEARGKPFNVDWLNMVPSALAAASGTNAGTKAPKTLDAWIAQYYATKPRATPSERARSAATSLHGAWKKEGVVVPAEEIEAALADLIARHAPKPAAPAAPKAVEPVEPV